MKKILGLLAVAGVAGSVLAAPNGYFKLNSDGTIDVVATEAELTTATVSGTVSAEQVTSTDDMTAAGTITAGQYETDSLSSGIGITEGTNTVVDGSFQKVGSLYTTRIYIDITGLNSTGAAGDIIGTVGASPAFLHEYDASVSGTCVAGTITCLEAPGGGEPDIDLYLATAATGSNDDAISGLAGQAAVLEAAADWTIGTTKAFTGMVSDGAYLYLVGSGGGDDAYYTAGKFLITIYGN